MKFPLYWGQNHYSRRTKDYVVSIDELSAEEIIVVEALQKLKKDCLDGDSQSLKDRLGEMASNNALALAEKRARREASKAEAAATIVAAATTSSTQDETRPRGEEASNTRPEKRPRTEKPKKQSDPAQGTGAPLLTSPQPASGCATPSRITWATPYQEEDAALKLLSQQGQRVFIGASASDMKEFLGQVRTWCLRGAMMAEFFHNTIDEVAALPNIKKDFESVTEKLNADEVKMTEALGKVKNLTDENLRLEENNTKLAEEITKLKAALAAKKAEAIQVVLEKQKVVEDAETEKENWRQNPNGMKIRYLNPDVELRTKGMSTLCVVRDGKWYRGVGKYFMEEMPGDEEITPTPIMPIPLKEDVEREEKKRPTESEMVDIGLGDGNA
ncbi:hypothetical protein SESBI_43899 [Sesbania bispinosa]|nr:hypothetical protein SESBI_43899 [Sesbania bispinosa]